MFAKISHGKFACVLNIKLVSLNKVNRYRVCGEIILRVAVLPLVLIGVSACYASCVQ